MLRKRAESFLTRMNETEAGAILAPAKAKMETKRHVTHPTPTSQPL
jgi:hypothetical protein